MARETEFKQPRSLGKVVVFGPSDGIKEGDGRLVMDRNIEYLQSRWGVDCEYSRNAFSMTKSEFGNGSPQQRIADIRRAAMDTEVTMLWAYSGGYDIARVIPLMDDPKIRERMHDDPLLFAGYSDISMLLLRALVENGSMSIMGPTFFGLRKWTEDSTKTVMEMAKGDMVNGIGPESGWIPKKIGRNIKVGGTLIPTNLGELTESMAMGMDPLRVIKGKAILAIEELEVPRNQVARYMDVVLGSPSADKIGAIMVGRLQNIRENEYPKWGAMHSTQEVIVDRCQTWGIPVVFLPKFGHVSVNDDEKLLRQTKWGKRIFYPLPMGMKVELTIGKESRLDYTTSVCK